MSGPGREKSTAGIGKTCRGFPEGKTITSKGLGMWEKAIKWHWKMETGNWGRKDFRRAWVMDERTSLDGNFGGEFGESGCG
jgi:hypothetical protein